MEAKEEFDFSSDEENFENVWKFDENNDISECINASTAPLRAESNKEINNSKIDMKIVSETNSSERKMSRVDLNTAKAGMEGLDKEKINQIIHEASKGSRFYENEKKKERQVQKRIEELQRKMASLTDEQKRKAQQTADKIVEELEQGRDLSRTIVHIDMDAFYAAVEMLDDPSLKSKPMAVGGSAMLCTSNYLARRYGVRAGMPGFIAKKLCPNLTVVPTNFDKYTKISHEIREVLAEYDRNYLPMSLDEAYLDITEYLITSRSNENGKEQKSRMGEVKDEETAKSWVKVETQEHEVKKYESTQETISVKTNEYDEKGMENGKDAGPSVVKQETGKIEAMPHCGHADVGIFRYDRKNPAQKNIGQLEKKLVKGERTMVVGQETTTVETSCNHMKQVSKLEEGGDMKLANYEHNKKCSDHHGAEGILQIDSTLSQGMNRAREHNAFINDGEEARKQLKGSGTVESANYETLGMVNKKERDSMPNFDGELLTNMAVQTVKTEREENQQNNELTEADRAEVQRIIMERELDHDVYINDSGNGLLEEPAVEREMFYNRVEQVVKDMRRKIEERTQLTASAGIAPNTFLAKVCSDKNKPNGQFYLKPEKEKIMEFVRELPLRKAFGIGRVSEQILTSVLKVNTCSELYDRRDLMQLLFTPTACTNYLEISLGLGSTVVDVDRERKSMSTETTFREINKPEEHFAKCRELCEELSDSLKAKGLRARKIGIKLKTINFEVKTRVSTSSCPVQESDAIFSLAKKLLVNEIRACSPEPLRLRLMGVRAAEFCDRGTVNEKKQPTILSMMKKSESVPRRVGGPSKACGPDDVVTMKSGSVGRIDEPRSLLFRGDVMASENHTATSNTNEQSSFHQPEDRKLDGNIKMQESSSFDQDVSTKKPNVLNCPVCGIDQTFTTGNVLLQLNIHIDKCLSNQENPDILKSNSGKQTNKDKQASKKRKRESSNTTAKRRPMDRFLTKHMK